MYLEKRNYLESSVKYLITYCNQQIKLFVTFSVLNILKHIFNLQADVLNGVLETLGSLRESFRESFYNEMHAKVSK